MSNGPGEPPNENTTTDDDVVLRVVEEFTNTVEESNREQSRIVIVTAMVALVSSIAGPLVALKINSDQIDSQAANAKTASALEQTRGEGEFIRTERRAAYTAFLAAYNNAALDLVGIGGKYTSLGYPPRAATRDVAAIVQSIKDVTRTYYTVNLVGSNDAVANADQAYGLFATYANDLIELGVSIVNGKAPGAADLATLSDQFEARYSGELIPASKTFIETGRDDMKANDPKPPDSN